MKWYLIKRILSVIPILILVSIVAFFLSRNTPQDPVESYLNNTSGSFLNDETSIEDSEEYKRAFIELGYNKPSFYFSVVPASYPVDYFHNTTDSLASTTFLNLPSIRWHGLNNQYHAWFIRALGFDFGNSFVDGQRANSKIFTALSWTSWLVLLSLFSVFAFGIPIGIYLSGTNNSWISGVLPNVLYLFYSIPVFWLATIMVVFFTTDDYGSITNIFPSVGMISSEYGVFDKLRVLLLPVLIITLHSAAYISRQTRSSILNEQKQNYTQTALSKGVKLRDVLVKHNLKNALIPLITIGTELIPSAFSGSLILEVIFNIPGIGRLLFDSIQYADYNVVFGLLMLIAVITSLSYLLGDILYAIVNPKIRLAKE